MTYKTVYIKTIILLTIYTKILYNKEVGLFLILRGRKNIYGGKNKWEMN